MKQLVIYSGSELYPPSNTNNFGLHPPVYGGGKPITHACLIPFSYTGHMAPGLQRISSKRGGREGLIRVVSWRVLVIKTKINSKFYDLMF